MEVESTLTDRYQTTVPETVRRALRLRKRDRIHYTIRPSGEVVISRAAAADPADPVLGQFLEFLAHEPPTRNGSSLSMPPWSSASSSLVGGVEMDLDAPLSVDDE